MPIKEIRRFKTCDLSVEKNTVKQLIIIKNAIKAKMAYIAMPVFLL